MIIYNYTYGNTVGEYISIGPYKKNFTLIYSITTTQFPKFFLIYTTIHEVNQRKNINRIVNDNIYDEEIKNEYIIFNYIMISKISLNTKLQNSWKNYINILSKQNDEGCKRVFEACRLYFTEIINTEDIIIENIINKISLIIPNLE